MNIEFILSRDYKDAFHGEGNQSSGWPPDQELYSSAAATILADFQSRAGRACRELGCVVDTLRDGIELRIAT